VLAMPGVVDLVCERTKGNTGSENDRHLSPTPFILGYDA